MAAIYLKTKRIDFGSAKNRNKTVICQLSTANYSLTTNFFLFLTRMGIENDIKQATFTDGKQKAMVNLLFTYGWIIERIKDFLAKEDITHQQFNILRILRGSNGKPLSTLQIRDRMLDKMSDTSRIVDRLVAKGLVKKTTCEKDKRLVDVVISDKGLKLLKRIDESEKQMSHIMDGLNEKDAEMLSSLLDKLRNSD
jgi:DNA-binding MarR family transcriptional regulator